ncbi:MAG: hypothetical protein PWQ20_1657 [Thermotogaceae bacterium]|jgi:hypothetical protein|nr:hypothetical protein [Thermotogaceae bacterium]MDN5338587.1 hypothetical protein [Thermotogaceae bacterium]
MISEKEKGYIVCEKNSKAPKLEVYDFINRFDGEVGVLKLKGKVIQEVAVTDNIQYPEDGKIVYKFYRENGKPLLPGSSLKGSVRTYFEFFFGNENADLVFGSNKGASRVLFEDKYLKEEWLTKVDVPKFIAKPKDRESKLLVKLYKLKPSEEYKNRTNQMEAIKKGRLNFNIIIQGLSPDALKAILFSFGLFKNYKFPLKIGRGKNIGYGAIEYEFVSYERSEFSKIQNIDYKKFLEDEKLGNKFLEKYKIDDELLSKIKELKEK